MHCDDIFANWINVALQRFTRHKRIRRLVTVSRLTVTRECTRDIVKSLYEFSTFS